MFRHLRNLLFGAAAIAGMFAVVERAAPSLPLSPPERAVFISGN